MIYLAMTAALWPVLYARFDIVPAALVLAALHCLDRHRERASAALLGLAGAVKLWPFALLPLWMAWERERRRARAAPILGRAADDRRLDRGAGRRSRSLPVLSLIGNRVASSARYHADRGLQIESTWATLVLVLDRLGLAEDERRGSVRGGAGHAGASPRSSPGSPCRRRSCWSRSRRVALATAVRGGRSPLIRAKRPGRAAGDDSGSVLENAVLAVILGCMIAAKVLSPQFILWVVPLLALVVDGTGHGVARRSSPPPSPPRSIPHLYPALMDRRPVTATP